MQELNQFIGIKLPTSGFLQSFGSYSQLPRGKCPFYRPPWGRLWSPSLIYFARLIRDITFSLHYRAVTRRRVLAVRVLGTLCYDIIALTWYCESKLRHSHSIMLPCSPQIKT